jgi:hypothetical protein
MHYAGENTMAEQSCAWFAGIDWGSVVHYVCLVDVRGTIIGEREFPHSGSGLAELGDWLLSTADALIDRGFLVHAINPKILDRLRDRFSVAGAKDDRRDAYVLADGVRTDRRLFRRLHVADPRLVELRAWSRLAEELQEERVRLSNRVHHQLCRYYPQMHKITDDLAAPWFLELWTIAPTPAKGSRLRKSTVEQLLKQHRIRRVGTATVLRTLQEPAIKVADGVAEAASIHMRSLVARLRLVNRELREAERKLDELCTAVGEADATSGEGLQRRDVVILKSMPGIGRINLATLLSEGSGLLNSRDYQGHCPVLHRLPSAAANRTSSSCATRHMFGCATQSITGHVSPPSTIPSLALAMPLYASAATRTDVPSVVSQTGCLAWHACCCNARRCLIRSLVDRPHRTGPLFEARQVACLQ